MKITTTICLNFSERALRRIAEERGATIEEIKEEIISSATCPLDWLMDEAYRIEEKEESNRIVEED